MKEVPEKCMHSLSGIEQRTFLGSGIKLKTKENIVFIGLRGNHFVMSTLKYTTAPRGTARKNIFNICIS